MKLFRKVLFWFHLSSGIAIAGFVIVMAGTGVLLTYQKQITAWADRRAVTLRPSSDGRLPVDTLLARAEAAVGTKPTAIVVRSNASAPAGTTARRRGAR